MKNRVITISREFGSGGRLIGQKLAEKLGVPLYDKTILDRIAEESGFSREMMEEAEKKALSGVGAQFDSEMVYHKISEDLSKQGVIYCNFDKYILVQFY